MLAIWLLNKVFDQNAPKAPTGNPPSSSSSNSTSAVADAARIKEWVDQAAKRGEEWGKQSGLTENTAASSPYSTDSANPQYSAKTIRRALPVEPTVSPTTPATSNASGIPRPTEAVGQKKAAIEQREHQAVHSDSPAEGKYPFARRAERPGFYYSPYTGRVYDLRRVADGGLVRDPATGKLFRKPWQNKESDSRGR